jgi:hypothetical protein
MKNSICFLLLSLFISGFPLIAQTGPAGVWQGDLDLGAEQKLRLQLVINKLRGGTYGISVYYMDQGAVKNPNATSVNFEAGKLSFSVDDLGGSYSGTLENKTITGEWRQGGNSIPMLLTPYKRSEPGSRDIAGVLGHWVGKVTYLDGLVLSLVCRFEKTEDNKLALFIDAPEMGGAVLPTADLMIEFNRINFRIPAIQAEYTGELTPEGIVGSLRAPGNYESDWNMVRGEYRPSIIRLDIPSEDMKKLQGRWAGRLGPVSVIFRFEHNVNGAGSIFVNFQEQDSKGIRVMKASLADGSLFLKFPGMEYTGKITGNSIDGTLTPLDQDPIPLVMTKE